MYVLKIEDLFFSIMIISFLKSQFCYLNLNTS